jgi:pimeloyl-ACP methyl ester carboxylesterase
MLMRSPEIQKRLETYQTTDKIEAKAIELEWRRAKRRRKWFRSTVASLALLGAGTSAYVNDVRANQDIQAKASITVQYEGAALNKVNDHKGLVFIDGFGTDNADTITKYIGAAVPPVIDGQLLSVGYNNAPLETTDIAKKLIATAEARGIDTLSFVGHSVGGDIAMLVQEEIRKESNLTIEAMILLSTPDGVKALRPARQNEIDLVQRVAWIPGIQYSSPLRDIGEIALRSDNYTHGDFWQNVSDFFATKNQVEMNLDNNKLPGMWLMFDQLLAIENSNLKDRINTMAKIPKDEVHPTIIYLGTASPGYDPIVDDKKTSKDLASYAKAADIPYLHYDVPGADHMRPDINAGYIETLAGAKKAIQSSIAEQQAIADLHRAPSTYGPFASLYEQ